MFNFKKNINDTVASAVEESINVETGKIEEWIWIDGFKGTDSDMKCRDYQFRIGIKGAKEIIYVEKLVSVGYSETFARYCFENDFTNIALSVGSQEGLSMDMKVWAIFNSNKK